MVAKNGVAERFTAKLDKLMTRYAARVGKDIVEKALAAELKRIDKIISESAKTSKPAKTKRRDADDFKAERAAAATKKAPAKKTAKKAAKKAE